MSPGRRRFRMVYLVVCAVLMVVAMRYVLRYQQMIEDAIHFNDKSYNDKK
jgi:hypothetical protein